MVEVSIIIPIYNAEKYLKECLESVINQSFKNIEILLINDGSKDSSSQIIKEFAQKDNRIVAINKENGGYASAINLGLDRARGEYISIVEADDYCALDMIEKMYNAISEKNADIATMDFYYLEDTQKNKKRIYHYDDKLKKNEENYFNLKISPSIIHKPAYPWKNLYKKSFIDKHNIRMPQDGLGAYEDQPWNASILSFAQKCVHVAKPLYYYRIDADGSSTNNGKKSLINYVKRRSQTRDILIKNRVFTEDVKEFYWIAAYYGSTFFHYKIDKKYKKEYFYEMQKLFKKSLNDNLKYEHYTHQLKMNFDAIMNKNYFSYLYYMFSRSVQKTLITINTHFGV